MQRRQRKEDPESGVSSNGTILIKIGYWSVSVVKFRHEKYQTNAYLFSKSYDRQTNASLVAGEEEERRSRKWCTFFAMLEYIIILNFLID